MKMCARCGEEKPLEHFPVNRASSDGRYRLCRLCNATALKARNGSRAFKAQRAAYLSGAREKVNAQARASYYRHHEKNKAALRARRDADKENRIAAASKWRVENPERVKANREAWFAARPGYVNERGMRRYATKINATPQWANLDAIRAVYAKARAMRKAGLDVHVDHIIPLRGANVVGFHVHTNLRIITAKDNRHKSNAWPM